jgi:hypothetical protein
MKAASISIFAVSIAVLFSCCISVSVSTQPINSGYLRLSEEDKQWVIFTDTAASICKPEKDGKIYAITGNQLRRCLEQDAKAMVYIWKVYNAKYYTLPQMQSYCDSLGITLYIIAEVYDSIKKIYYEQATISAPIFGVNEQYYGTPGRGNEYIRLFISDLIHGTELTSQQLFGVNHCRFLVFDRGVLTSFSKSLEGNNTVK